MKKPWAILISLAIFLHGYGQSYIDSLHGALSIAGSDSSRVIQLCKIAQYYEHAGTDSNEYYVRKAMELARQIDFRYGIYLANRSLFFANNLKANYPKALELALENLKFSDSLKQLRLYRTAFARQDLALVRREMGDTIGFNIENQLFNELLKKSGYEDNGAWIAYSLEGFAYLRKGDADSGIALLSKSYQMAQRQTYGISYLALATARFGEGYRMIHKDSIARAYYQIGLAQCDYFHNFYIKARIYMNLAQLFALHNQDSSLYFGRLCVELCQRYNFGDYASTAADSMTRIFKARHEPDSALKYVEVMINAKDSIFSAHKMQQFQILLSKQEQKQIQAEQEKERYQSKVKLYTSIAALALFLVISFILYRNNKQKQKANRQLHQQKLEIENALSTLQTTQKQLIQSEKMASLGELTAGIAHEIQNPLNFVNNFSELNGELLEEMESDFKEGKMEKGIAIAADLKQNLEKINQHGKRADAIVKGMLQHSRPPGEKQLTDINALAEEYLRLSLHGMMAKDNSFTCDVRKDLDSSIGSIKAMPQDLGRVFLNIYNNAFYSVTEKKKNQGDQFEPRLFITSKKTDHKIEITIRDNGPGIPQKSFDKIFQPFYTTKPTGQGTGLGLSLAYDIIVKEHGGQIRVNSEEGKYAEFVITLADH